MNENIFEIVVMFEQDRLLLFFGPIDPIFFGGCDGEIMNQMKRFNPVAESCNE